MVQNLRKMLLVALHSIGAVVSWVVQPIDAMLCWLTRQCEGWMRKSQKVYGGQRGAVGGGVIATLFVALILIFVGLYFIASLVPMFGNITNPGGTVGTFLTLAEWVIPLLAIVGLIVYGATHFLGAGGSSGGGGATHKRRSRKK